MALLFVAFQRPASSAPSLSGTGTFVILDCAKDTIALRFVSATKPLAVRTDKIKAAGTPSQTVPWSIAWRLPVPTEPGINEYEAVGTIGNRCPTLGKYALTVKIVSGPDGSGEPLDFSLERQTDASLYVAPAMTTTVSEYVPRTDPLQPAAGLLVREESQSNPLTAITLMPGELKSSSGEFVGVRIAPADSKPIFLGAGKTLEIPLRLSSRPPAGIYSARLVLRSPELSAAATVDLTLKVRVGLGYLLVILAGGVGIGWFINVRLATAAKFNGAMIDALRTADRCVARAHAQRDPAVQQRLVALAGALESRSRNCQTDAQLKDLMQSIEAAATDIETTAATTLKTLLQDLAATRSLFAANTAPLDPLITDSLRLDLDNLARIERVSEAGDVEEATRQLQAYRRGLPATVRPALQSWLASINTLLQTQLGKWAPPAEEPERTRAVLVDRIAKAYASSEYAAMIQQSNSLAFELRGWVALTLPTAVTGVFRAVADTLRAGSRANVAAAVDSFAGDILEVPTGDPVAAVSAIAALRQRVEDLLLAANPKAVYGDVDEHLRHGDFVGAAELVAPQSLPQPAGALAPGTGTSAPKGARPRALLTLPAAGNRAVPLRVRLPPDMTLGQSVTVGLDWLGTPPRGIAITWTCGSDAATVTTDAHNITTLVATKPGYLTLTAAIPDYADVSASTYIGSVRQTPTYLAVERRDRQVNWITWAVTAILTTGVGFEIFAASWLGTPADFMSAFLWGFFGQFGLDRVRDLAKPVTSRTLS